MTTVFSCRATPNCLTNLYSRDLGLLSTANFVTHVNTQRLDSVKLSKYRAIPSASHSINWLNLDNVENR